MALCRVHGPVMDLQDNLLANAELIFTPTFGPVAVGGTAKLPRKIVTGTDGSGDVDVSIEEGVYTCEAMVASEINPSEHRFGLTVVADESGEMVFSTGLTSVAVPALSLAQQAQAAAAGHEIAAGLSAAQAEAAKDAAIAAGTVDIYPSQYGAVGDGVADDSAAILAWLTDGIATNKTMVVPAGTFRLASRVTVAIPDLTPVTITGSGANSIFVVDNTDGGIQLTSAHRTSPVYIRDFTVASRVVRGGVGFEYSVPSGGNQDDRIFTAENINIVPETYAGTDQGWAKGFVAEGMYRPLLSNVVVTQSFSSTNTMDVGISVDGTFKHHVENCYVLGFCTIALSDVGTTGEGGYVHNTTLNGGVTNYKRVRDGNEPEFWVLNCHMNTAGTNIDIDGCKYGWIENNLLYASHATEGAGVVDILIRDGRSINIAGNAYRGNLDTTRIHVSLQTAGSTIGAPVIDDITIRGEKLAATAALHVFAASTVTNLTLERATPATEAFVSYPADPYDIRTTSYVMEDALLLQTFSNNATSGPDKVLRRLSNTPAANDYLGSFQFEGYNDALELVRYAQISSRIIDPTDGAESGKLELFTVQNGALVSEYSIGDGAAVGDLDPQGAGSINATSYFVGDTEGWSGSVLGSNALTVEKGLITGATVGETVQALSGTTPTLDPALGTIATHTLTGNTTYTDGLSSGQSMVLYIDDGTDFTVTWPSGEWMTGGGVAPVLAATGYTVVTLSKVGSSLYLYYSGEEAA